MRARRNTTITLPREVTYRTAAVPLGITAPRRRAENDDFELRRRPLVERHQTGFVRFPPTRSSLLPCRRRLQSRKVSTKPSLPPSQESSCASDIPPRSRLFNRRERHFVAPDNHFLLRCLAPTKKGSANNPWKCRFFGLKSCWGAFPGNGHLPNLGISEGLGTSAKQP